MSKIEKEYYIGLDVGTNSVGWAVTDADYNLLRMRGRDMWGSYLFDEAQTAAERRSYRTARRRTERRHQRLMLLQELFAPDIEKVDPLFFIRLNNSSLFMEDKDGRLDTKDSLFGDKGYTDRDFHEEYPTVYHLRAAMREGEIKDVRLLYLAVHHIVKKRGHFLFEAQSFGVGDRGSVKEKLGDINEVLRDLELSQLDVGKADEMLDVLEDRSLSRSDKSRKMMGLCGVDRKNEKHLVAIIKAVCGLSFRITDIFDVDTGSEKGDYSFDTPDFDDLVLPEIASLVGEDDARLVTAAKAVYDWAVLSRVMGGKAFISDAKVASYEKHSRDLDALKRHVRENYPEKYALVFRKSPGVCNYAAYVGSDRGRSLKRCSKQDFYKFLGKEVPGDGYIDSEIARGEFMPLLSSTDNGVIPYQVHLSELRAILDNAEMQFPFLREESDGMTVREKIERLMTFRIPYYVGPLDSSSPFAWVKRNPGYEKVKVTPWNFDDAVDRDASEGEFISRMTSKCTYLRDQDVLPENSLLYSEYVFRNELNNLRVYGEKLDSAAREAIYGYALGHKKVTLKKCLEVLKNEGHLPSDADVNVFSGTDGDFKSSLGSFVDLHAILGDKVDKRREMCEEIITWVCVMSDKSRLERRIREKYGKVLSDAEIKRLKGLNYTKWGRLSSELLDGITSSSCADEDGRPLTVIRAMRLTGENFMTVYFKYGFAEAVEERNGGTDPGRVTYKTVKEMYCSPAVKRSIWRTVSLVKEIVKICGKAPKKVFVEMGREVRDDSRKGKRVISRKQQLYDWYKGWRDEERDWAREIDAQPDSRFDSDKLVLYYRQMGRSMYSGKPIALEDVFDTNICDIDHIYPRSKIKDDSLDNRVLVFKTENAEKKDVYPLPAGIRSEMHAFWGTLRDHGLISGTKYERLTRATPLSEDEMSDFINRQLTFTLQSTKAVAETLKRLLGDGTEIVYAKAGNANEFKQKNDIIKIRDLNDYHHAKDAYVNIVVGNVYNTKFGHDAKIYFAENGTGYNLTKLYDSDIPGAWRVSDRGRIIDTVEKNTCNVVRMTAANNGQMFDLQLKPAGDSELMPRKEGGAITDTQKYGGYGGVKMTYFLLVRSKDKKGNAKLTIVPYPLYMERRYPGDIERKTRYCVEQFGLVNPEIMLDHIGTNTLICKNGVYAYMRGYTGTRIILCNANELRLGKEHMRTLKKISSYMGEKKRLGKKDLSVKSDIDADENLALYDEFADKLNIIYKPLWVKGEFSVFLMEKRDVFTKLSLKEQCDVLYQILNFMQCKPGTADLSILGGSGHMGAIYLNEDITSAGIKIIYQSPTGYYRRVIDTAEFL